mmetsp:Transcript_5196/g.7644  ORF Transcript_5196/g.7644 Transcript_5196/m.7644 type:complete len:805 (-) Transcript_5196:112-2526(-)
MISSSSNSRPTEGLKQPRQGGKEPRHIRHSGEKHPRPTEAQEEGSGRKRPRQEMDSRHETGGKSVPDLDQSFESKITDNSAEDLPALEIDDGNSDLELTRSKSAPGENIHTVSSETAVGSCEDNKESEQLKEKEGDTSKKIWGIIAKFANGKRLNGILDKDEVQIKWKAGYKWKRSVKTDTGILGEWIDAGGSKVRIDSNTITGPPSLGAFSWYPATVVLLTGEKVHKITVNFADQKDQKKHIGTLDAFGKSIIWTGGMKWTRNENKQAPFGEWMDENNIRVEVGVTGITGTGPKYPAKVIGWSVEDGFPQTKKPVKPKKKPKKPKLRKGELPEGVDVIATFANKSRLEGKVEQNGHQIVWKGGYKWNRTIETGGIVLVQGNENEKWEKDIKGKWYDAVKVPVTITEKEITGPLNGWYPAKINAMRKEWGGPELPPPKPKPAKMKKPKMIRGISTPNSFMTPRRKQPSPRPPVPKTPQHREPDIAVRFANGSTLQGYLSREGFLHFFPGNFRWTPRKKGSGVLGIWTDAGGSEVRIAHDQIHGPLNGWYPANIIPASTLPKLPPSMIARALSAAPAPIPSNRSSSKKKSNKKIPTPLSLNHIPADIRRMSADETRMEIKRVKDEIQNLDKKLSSVKNTNKRKKSSASSVSLPGIIDIQDMDPEEALREKRRVEKTLEQLNATIRKKSNAKQQADIFKELKKLLKNLMKHKFAWVFNEPVDPIKLNLPTYFEVIKHPMDLGTVKDRLDRGFYANSNQFAGDVRLVFKNAQTFNPPAADVHRMAATLKDIFEEKYSKIRQLHSTRY